MQSHSLNRFRTAYAEHRRREGYGENTPLHQLPYVRTGPLKKTWSVRQRSFEETVRAVIEPLERETNARLTILDLGAGNGWLSYRMAQRGHDAVAIDLRSDTVDGLGVRDGSAPGECGFRKIAADFSTLPLPANVADICVFNASFHYATSVSAVLRESIRVTRRGGKLAIVDTPFYGNREDGELMVAEKRRGAGGLFGDLAPDLTSLPFIEFLTPTLLAAESEPFGLEWTRHRVRYPLWYELRPLLARARRARTPSRFDVWESVIPG